MSGASTQQHGRMDPTIDDPRALAAAIADPLGDDDHDATIAFLGGDDDAFGEDWKAANSPKTIDEAFAGSGSPSTDATGTGDGTGKESGADAGTAGAGAEADAGKTTGTDGSGEGAGTQDAGATGAQADPGGGADASGADGAQPTGDPAGVYGADGQVLPYDVLAITRQRATNLQEENRELRRRLLDRGAAADADAGARQDTSGQADATPPVDTKALREKVTALKENYGEDIGEVLDGLMTGVEKLTDQNTRLQRHLQDTAAGEQHNAQNALQRDIEAIPELAKWQADAIAFEQGDLEKDPSYFADAETFDERLALRPEWANKPRPERFQRAVSMVKMMRGEAPSSGSPSASTDTGGEPAPAATGDVDRIIADAQRASRTPGTAGEVTGAAPASDTDKDPLDSMDDTELETYLLNATPEQRQAFYAGL